jgi:hypothetical protein
MITTSTTAIGFDTGSLRYKAWIPNAASTISGGATTAVAIAYPSATDCACASVAERAMMDIAASDATTTPPFVIGAA